MTQEKINIAKNYIIWQVRLQSFECTESLQTWKFKFKIQMLYVIVYRPEENYDQKLPTSWEHRNQKSLSILVQFKLFVHSMYFTHWAWRWLLSKQVSSNFPAKRRYFEILPQNGKLLNKCKVQIYVKISDSFNCLSSASSFQLQVSEK